MAVVKVKYMRGKEGIKAHLRYLMHRTDQDGERITRPLFDNTDLTDKWTAYSAINAATRATVFYKMMISPDRLKEDSHKDLDLQQVTRQTIRNLEKLLDRKLQFFATIHDNTEHRHMQGFFLLQGRISKEQFYALRKIAYQSANREIRLQRKGYNAGRKVRQRLRIPTYTAPKPHRQPFVKQSAHRPTCQNCGRSQIMRPRRNGYYCWHCGRTQEQSMGLRL